MALRKEPAALEPMPSESSNNGEGEAPPWVNNLLTIKESANLPGVKISRFYAQTSAKKISFLRLGGKMRFMKANVDGRFGGE
jgi:excisionase family DNA binding protein